MAEAVASSVDERSELMDFGVFVMMMLVLQSVMTQNEASSCRGGGASLKPLR